MSFAKLNKFLFYCYTLVSHFLKVGDTLPSVEVHEGAPEEKINILELFKGKKGILFAVPGAFTPGCSKV